MEDSVDRLQHISVVSKVCTELQNHVGLNDKDLAEFIVHLAGKSKNPERFRKKLKENGCTIFATTQAVNQSVFVPTEWMLAENGSKGPLIYGCRKSVLLRGAEMHTQFEALTNIFIALKLPNVESMKKALPLMKAETEEDDGVDD